MRLDSAQGRVSSQVPAPGSGFAAVQYSLSRLLVCILLARSAKIIISLSQPLSPSFMPPPPPPPLPLSSTLVVPSQGLHGPWAMGQTWILDQVANELETLGPERERSGKGKARLSIYLLVAELSEIKIPPMLIKSGNQSPSFARRMESSLFYSAELRFERLTTIIMIILLYSAFQTPAGSDTFDVSILAVLLSC